MPSNADGAVEINVSLDVYGFEASPEEITRILQISPTRTALRGEPITGTTLLKRVNRWILDSGAPQEAPLAAHLEQLLIVLSGAESHFRGLPPDAEIQVYCVIYDRDRSVPLMFPAHFVKLAGEIGAQINLVYYDMRG